MRHTERGRQTENKRDIESVRHTERERQTENKRDIKTALISTLVSVEGEDSLVPRVQGCLYQLDAEPRLSFRQTNKSLLIIGYFKKENFNILFLFIFFTLEYIFDPFY